MHQLNDVGSKDKMRADFGAGFDSVEAYQEELEKSKLSVLFKTNMVDFAMDIYKELHGTKDVPASMSARRDEVVATMQALLLSLLSMLLTLIRALVAPSTQSTPDHHQHHHHYQHS